MIIARIVQFVKIVQPVQLDYYGYIKFFGGFVGTWVGAFTEYLDLNPLRYRDWSLNNTIQNTSVLSRNYNVEKYPLYLLL